MRNYAIKEGYVACQKNKYYEDKAGTTIWQPDVYTAAVELARKIGADTIIDIGSGNGVKLIPYKKEFRFIFVDFGPNLKIIEDNIGKNGNKYIHQDLEKGFPEFSKEILSKSVAVCSDVIEHLIKPEILTKKLVDLSKVAPFVVISTPDRQRTRGLGHYGPPQNQTHVREWSMEELDTFFRAYSMKDHLTGITRSNNYEQGRQTTVIVAGTYLSDILKSSYQKVNVRVEYSSKMVFAQKYYNDQLVNIGEKLAQPDIFLNKNEWLAAPNSFIKIGSLINDARAKGYGFIEAQVIYVDPAASYSWPETGIIRQGRSLIGLLGEVRKFTIGKTRNKSKIYPIQLMIFSRKKVGNHKLGNSFPLGKSRLIDTGHLADDYLLEGLVGWSILGP